VASGEPRIQHPEFLTPTTPSQLLPRQCRVDLQRRSAGEVGRGDADRGVAGAATPSRRCVPRGDRNFENHTVTITYAIDEGPRAYIERINVRGNTRHPGIRGSRREFDISEGDAYNRALVDRAERRLKKPRLLQEA